MRTAVHPDGPKTLGGLRPNVDGDQLHGVRVPVFPDAEVPDRAHLIRRDVAIALMLLESQTRGVVGEGPETSRFIDSEPSIISNLRACSPLQPILVDRGRPIARKINGRGREGGCMRRRRGLSEKADLRQQTPPRRERSPNCFSSNSLSFFVPSI